MKYIDKSFLVSGLILVAVIAVICKLGCTTYVYAVDDKGRATGKPNATLRKSFFGFGAGGDLTPKD